MTFASHMCTTKYKNKDNTSEYTQIIHN